MFKVKNNRISKVAVAYQTPLLTKKKHLPFQHIQNIQTLESVTFRILDLKNEFSSELLTVPNTNEIAWLILFTSTVIHEKCMAVYSTNIKNTKKWLDSVKFRFVLWLIDTSGWCFPTEHFEFFSLLTSSKAMVTSVMRSCCSPNAERLHSA